jgi:hypothetical protein
VLESISGGYILGALAGATALVLRMVKARAEVNDWNKAGRNNDPVGDAVIATDSGSNAA